ncbi:hypothetical protein IX38_21470 [Chryseobacterium luteum]|uniref:Uncharacterized protein n=1 Tax=Chryseobacterium luteum TaxID=421531 RepID=A0A085YY33_9FLAO|nr:hypothetical protein IX38_21470 [Chryseobacterium luteum]
MFCSQMRNDRSACDSIDLQKLKKEFIKHPTCEKYKEIIGAYGCLHFSIDDFEIMNIATKKCNCKDAYFDLYHYYKKLNFKLSDQSDCDSDSMLLNNLSLKMRKHAISSLIKSNLESNSELSIYYYYGIYVKKDQKKAIKMIKKSYTYKISDESAEQDLKDWEESILPCSAK